MKLNRLKQIALLSIVLLTAGQLSAQNQDSLWSYLRTAAENNPAINADFISYKSALEAIPQAGAFDDPTLDMAFFFQPMDIVGGRQVADFSLMQMFPWFGTKKAARSEATHMAEAAYERFRERRDEVFYKVYTQWYTITKLREQIEYNIENYALLERLYDLASTRYSSSTGGGKSSGAMSEVFRIKLEMNELESERESIKSELKAEEARLNALLNRPADSPIAVNDSLVQVPFIFNHDTMEQIKEYNPTLEGLVKESAAYRAQERYAHRASLPQFGIGVNYTLVNRAHKEMGAMWGSMNGDDMWMPMVSITLPIFRRKYNSKIKQSQYLRMAAEEQYKNTLNEIEADLRGVKHEIDDAERKIGLYKKQSELAKSTYELAIKEYMADKVELNSLIEILRQMLDYRVKSTEAVSDYNIRVAAVERLISFTKKYGE